MFERRNQTVLTNHYQELHAGGNTAFKVDDTNDDDEIFSHKRKIDWDTMDIASGQLPVSSHNFFLLTVDIETTDENSDLEEGVG